MFSHAHVAGEHKFQVLRTLRGANSARLFRLIILPQFLHGYNGLAHKPVEPALEAWSKLLRRVTFSWGESHQSPTKGRSLWKPQNIIVFYRGVAQVRPGPGGADWIAGHIFGSFLLRWQLPFLPPGPQAWRKRPRPAAVGRGAPQVGPKPGQRRTIPAATEPKRAAFPLGMANALRPGLRGTPFSPMYGGVDSTRRGKAPPWAILSPISHRGEMGPSGASLQAGTPAPREGRKGERARPTPCTHPINSWSSDSLGTNPGSMVSKKSKARTSSNSSWRRWFSSGTAAIRGRA